MNTTTKDNSLLYFAILVSFLIFTVRAVGQNTISLNHDAEIKANQLLETHIDEKVFTGIAAGISIQGNRVWSAAEGYSDRENKKAMEIKTITRTASIAKSMTAVAIMQLVEQGLLDLDAPIQTYIPAYPKRKKGIITTRQLLTQTSGIPAYDSAKEAQTQKQYDNLAAAVNEVGE